MISWAEAEFRRARVRGDGATDAEHSAALERMRKRAGRSAKKPNVIPEAARLRGPPLALVYVWRWFLDVLSGVPGNGMAPAGVGWRDLESWMAVTGNVLRPWEAQLIVRLSQIRVAVVSEKQAKPKT